MIGGLCLKLFLFLEVGRGSIWNLSIDLETLWYIRTAQVKLGNLGFVSCWHALAYMT